MSLSEKQTAQPYISQYALSLICHIMIISDIMVMVTAHRSTSESNLKSRTRPRDQVSVSIAQADE